MAMYHVNCLKLADCTSSCCVMHKRFYFDWCFHHHQQQQQQQHLIKQFCLFRLSFENQIWQLWQLLTEKIESVNSMIEHKLLVPKMKKTNWIISLEVDLQEFLCNKGLWVGRKPRFRGYGKRLLCKCPF